MVALDRILNGLLGGDLHVELVHFRIDRLDAKDLGAKFQEAPGVLAPHIAHPGGEDHGQAGAVGDLGVKCRQLVLKAVAGPVAVAQPGDGPGRKPARPLWASVPTHMISARAS